MTQIILDIPQNLQIQLVNIAKQQNLSLNDYVIQCLLKDSATNKLPNCDTQKTIEDARTGKNMQKMSLDELRENL